MLEIVLVAGCLSCLAGVWHFYDVARQARLSQRSCFDRYAKLNGAHAELTRDRDDWKRKHEALVLVVKIRGGVRRA